LASVVVLCELLRSTSTSRLCRQQPQWLLTAVDPFARARCDDCEHDYFVAFSCQGRGRLHIVQHPAHGGDGRQGRPTYWRNLRAFVGRALLESFDAKEMLAYQHCASRWTLGSASERMTAQHWSAC